MERDCDRQRLTDKLTLISHREIQRQNETEAEAERHRERERQRATERETETYRKRQTEEQRQRNIIHTMIYENIILIQFQFVCGMAGMAGRMLAGD